MKIQHLRYFTAVVDHGGVIRASERLHMTQPSVSAGLKALEQDLGCSLFERGAGRLRLTQAGIRFYRRAVEILRQCDMAKAEALGTGNLPTIRLGVLSTLSDRIVAEMAAGIARRAADTKVVFRIGGVDRMATWMKQGRIDAALTVDDGEPLAGRSRPLHSEPFVCFASKRHWFAGKSSIRLQDLAGEAFVMRSRCEKHRTAQAVFRAERIAMNVVAVADSDGSALALVRQGVGVMLAPLSLREDGVCAVGVEDLSLERSVGLFWRDEVPAACIDAIGEVVRATLADPGDALADGTGRLLQ